MLCRKSKFIYPCFCPACIVPNALMSILVAGAALPLIVLKLAGMLLLNISKGSGLAAY